MRDVDFEVLRDGRRTVGIKLFVSCEESL